MSILCDSTRACECTRVTSGSHLLRGFVIYAIVIAVQHVRYVLACQVFAHNYRKIEDISRDEVIKCVETIALEREKWSVRIKARLILGFSILII